MQVFTNEKIVAIENEIARLQAIERRLRIERSLSAIHGKVTLVYRLTNLEHELGHELLKEIKSQHSIDEKLSQIEAVLNIA